LLSSLYIYPIGELDYADFIDGQNGVALPEIFLGMRVGDIFEVTTEGCSEYLKACHNSFPPPTILRLQQ
jgi:hypothetical protein